MMLRIQEHNPSVVIINDDKSDSRNVDTIEIIRQTLHEFPSLKILLVIDNYDLDKELKALKIGTRGIFIENFEQEGLNDSIY